jgi:hypothetical protein
MRKKDKIPFILMNYDYSYSVDYWHPAHNTQIQNNKVWYGQ